MRRLASVRSSSTTAMRTRAVVPFACPPKTLAKIEKKTMGSRNVSACATRSRRRLIQLIFSSVPIIRAAPFPSGE